MKYVFIINSLGDSHWRNRVSEFVERGLQVELYAYSRNGEKNNYKGEWPVNVLADFQNTLSYIKRLRIFIRTLKNVAKIHKNEDVCYYYFGLDLAMVMGPMINKPYLYEEFDLMHTYVGNPIVKNILEWIDKRIIRKAKLTLFTSEGFADYHFGDNVPQNICYIPNRLNPAVVNTPVVPHEAFDINHIKFGFVGGPRYKTMANFAKVIAQRFPQHEMHFYGRIDVTDEHFFTELKKCKNIFFHGAFKNPVDLPEIYSKIDVLLSAYDADFENVRYAEPNKIYEAIYFETPIVVSSNTFLAKKVKKIGIGWDLNCMDDEEVINFVNDLSCEKLNSKKEMLAQIDKSEALNVNDELFERLAQS